MLYRVRYIFNEFALSLGPPNNQKYTICLELEAL